MFGLLKTSDGLQKGLCDIDTLVLALIKVGQNIRGIKERDKSTKASWWPSKVMRFSNPIFSESANEKRVFHDTFLHQEKNINWIEQGKMSLHSFKFGSRQQSLNNYFDCLLSALLACSPAVKTPVQHFLNSVLLPIWRQSFSNVQNKSIIWCSLQIYTVSVTMGKYGKAESMIPPSCT